MVLCLFAPSFAPPLAAADDRYRIEVLIFRHLDSEWPPRDVERLRDFSYALDLQPRPVLAADDELAPADIKPSHDSDAELEERLDQRQFPGDVAAPPDFLNPLLEDPLEEVVPYQPWAEVMWIEEMSDVMRGSWRRLHLSAPFRPLQFLAWEQNAEGPYPTMRIRNTEILVVEDPWVEQRAERNARKAAAEVAKLSEQGDKDGVIDDDTAVVYGDAHETAPPAEPEATDAQNDLMADVIPDPLIKFVVDGTSRLRKSRFLHLELDMVLRTALYEAAPIPVGFQVHRLRQSRQIKTMRMEYFDSPVIGVLAWITPIDVDEEAETEGETVTASGP